MEQARAGYNRETRRSAKRYRDAKNTIACPWHAAVCEPRIVDPLTPHYPIATEKPTQTPAVGRDDQGFQSRGTFIPVDPSSTFFLFEHHLIIWHKVLSRPVLSTSTNLVVVSLVVVADRNHNRMVEGDHSVFDTESSAAAASARRRQCSSRSSIRRASTSGLVRLEKRQPE